ncbi:MAG: co-chaperone GroES [Oscillospiraceae bacterium]|nr:co-chaperone GroES [Oscillospiraceae bacterium]
MELIPLFDRVVLKMTEAETTTKSGIILTETAAEKPQVAEVVAVGPGGMVDGFDVEMVVEVGDKVIIGKYAGTEVKVGDDKCIIVRQNDILARVED